MLNFIDKALSLLPFNDNKTIVGAALKLILPTLTVQFPILLAVAPLLDSAADLLIEIGLFHKGIKAAKPKAK